MLTIVIYDHKIFIFSFSLFSMFHIFYKEYIESLYHKTINITL